MAEILGGTAGSVDPVQPGLPAWYDQTCGPNTAGSAGQVFLPQMVMSACLEELDVPPSMDRLQIAESMGLDLWASRFACLTWPGVQVQ